MAAKALSRSKAPDRGRNMAQSPAQPPEVFYRIHSLLYTLRTIAEREDQLCVLMHHLRTSGKLNATLSAELHEILEKIPGQAYLDDLHALQSALDKAGLQPGTAPRQPARRKVA